MLYLSIAMVVCFILYIKYKPEITINHTHFVKQPDPVTKPVQTEKDVEEQESDIPKSMDDAIQVINNILNGGEELDEK